MIVRESRPPQTSRVDRAQYAQVAWTFAQRLTRAFNQCVINSCAAPMIGHVRQPGVHFTAMVDKWEGDFLFPLKEARFDHGFQRRIRHSQRAHAIRVIDMTETSTFLGATDLKPWLLLRGAYIQEKTIGAQGGMDYLQSVHDAFWRDSTQGPGEDCHVECGWWQLRRRDIPHLKARVRSRLCSGNSLCFRNRLRRWIERENGPRGSGKAPRHAPIPTANLQYVFLGEIDERMQDTRLGFLGIK
jgi:hypothetical protein